MFFFRWAFLVVGFVNFSASGAEMIESEIKLDELDSVGISIDIKKYPEHRIDFEDETYLVVFDLPDKYKNTKLSSASYRLYSDSGFVLESELHVASPGRFGINIIAITVNKLRFSSMIFSFSFKEDGADNYLLKTSIGQNDL